MDQRQQVLRRPGQRARLAVGPPPGEQPAELRAGQGLFGEQPPGRRGELLEVHPRGGPAEAASLDAVQ
jgi:hypothetical protein